MQRKEMQERSKEGGRKESELLENEEHGKECIQGECRKRCKEAMVCLW